MATILKLLNNPAPDDSSNKRRLMRDAVTEFMMTTIFVNFGTLSAVSTGTRLGAQGADVARVLPIAVSFGVSIMALAYSFGHLTGGHMNPGVSLLMFFRREISLLKMFTYWVAQFTGALLGAAITWGCVSGLAGSDKALLDQFEGLETFSRPPFQLGSTTLNEKINTGNGFLLEFMGSFFFYLVIAQTALDKRGIAESFFPAFPIGFILIVVHICLIPFTGCGVNPARTFGPSMVTCMASSESCDSAVGSWYWIYYIGPFLAAWAVAEVTEHLSWDDDDVVAQTINEAAETPEVKALEILKAQDDEEMT